MPKFTSFIKLQCNRQVLSILILAISTGVLGGSQREVEIKPPPGEEKRLPNGKLQSEEILRSDHESNLKDLDQMKKLVEGVQEDLTKNDRHVLSRKALKDLEEIERLSKRVRSRMTRY